MFNLKQIDMAILGFLVIGFFLTGCQKDTPDQEQEGISTLSVRLATSPDRLNPMLSRTLTATHIENLIMPSMAEYDPVTLELSPVLIETLPPGLKISEGDYEGNTMFQMKIREEAQWENGSPVTGEDYVFTLKTIFNPYVKASWRNILQDIKKVYFDPDDPLKIGTVVKSDMVLSQSIATNFNIYPKYAYDPDGLLDDVPLDDLLQKDQEELSRLYPQLETFAQAFLSEKYSREIVTGAGPYRLESWNDNIAVTLVRKENHWMESIDGGCLFQSTPSRIIYRVIPDENTALTALRDGQIDIMSDISPDNFAQLQTENANLSFHTPQLMNYYYIGLNGQDPLLEDRRVRQALAQLLDVDEIIERLMGGLAARTVGPINPQTEYYNDALKPLAMDLDMARSLLDEAGWKDLDGDGLREKSIDGRAETLSLTLKTTPRKLGQQIAVILQENAKKVGVEIQIESKEFRAYIKEVRQGDFHLANLVSTHYPGYYDPYSTWHTDNIGGAGRNYLGFGDAESDKMIETIRTTLNDDDRQAAYLEFQKMIYEDQPAIFLFSPTERIACNADYDLLTSSRRPGYFEQCLSLNREE